MGWLKRLFSRRPEEAPDEDVIVVKKEDVAEDKPKVISLDEAKKLDGWKKYKAKGLIPPEELIVEARLFTEDDPEVDLVTAKAKAGTYISICDLGASVFHKETFEATYEKV
jgi:hypothetical protein